jgi:hypothetical protein
MSEARCVHLLHQVVARDDLHQHFYQAQLEAPPADMDQGEQQMAVMLTTFQRLTSHFTGRSSFVHSCVPHSEEALFSKSCTRKNLDFVDFVLFYQQVVTL